MKGSNAAFAAFNLLLAQSGSNVNVVDCMGSALKPVMYCLIIFVCFNRWKCFKYGNHPHPKTLEALDSKYITTYMGPKSNAENVNVFGCDLFFKGQNKVYMGLIIKGTIPGVPPFSLWKTASEKSARTLDVMLRWNALILGRQWRSCRLFGKRRCRYWASEHVSGWDLEKHRLCLGKMYLP